MEKDYTIFIYNGTQGFCVCRKVDSKETKMGFKLKQLSPYRQSVKAAQADFDVIQVVGENAFKDDHDGTLYGVICQDCGVYYQFGKRDYVCSYCGSLTPVCLDLTIGNKDPRLN